MDFQPGDKVVTLTGERGTVVLTSRLTVFVRFTAQGEDDTIKGYLESQLTKIDPCEPDSIA